MENRTKTNQDREITLCPRALEPLRAQLALRKRLVASGRINHNFVFFDRPHRLLVAYEDDHSVATMEQTYAAWTKGAKSEDAELIKAVMAGRPTNDDDGGEAMMSVTIVVATATSPWSAQSCHQNPHPRI